MFIRHVTAINTVIRVSAFNTYFTVIKRCAVIVISSVAIADAV